MPEGGGQKRPVVTVQTAFSIIETLKTNGESTLDELSSELPLAKSTVHRHIETLVKDGYVLKENGHYRLGLRFLDVGIQARRDEKLFPVIKNRVDRLAIETGEKVWCVVEEDGMAVPLYRNAGDNTEQMHISIGEFYPLHQLATGKAILANLPPSRIDEIIEETGLPGETENTITDRDALEAELEEIRETDVAFNREESGHRLHAVGAPIRDDENVAIGAISVSGSKRRLQGELFTEEIPDRLLKVTNDIELDLLYS